VDAAHTGNPFTFESVGELLTVNNNLEFSGSAQQVKEGPIWLKENLKSTDLSVFNEVCTVLCTRLLAILLTEMLPWRCSLTTVVRHPFNRTRPSKSKSDSRQDQEERRITRYANLRVRHTALHKRPSALVSGQR
jgi:hypothetical protein